MDLSSVLVMHCCQTATNISPKHLGTPHKRFSEYAFLLKCQNALVSWPHYFTVSILILYV